jgi:Ca2+-binding EF-hand superfamily protein
LNPGLQRPGFFYSCHLLAAYLEVCGNPRIIYYIFKVISPLQIKKIRHFFDVLDTDKNGYIEPTDFKSVALKISEKAALPEHSKEFDNLLVQSYRIFIQVLTDLEKHEDLEIHSDEWVKFFHKNLLDKTQSGEPMIHAYITRVVYYIFNLFDKNGDQYISPDEYVRMFEVYNIDSSTSKSCFDKLDTSKDNLISKEELAQALKEFFFSSDENAPGNWIFGEWRD